MLTVLFIPKSDSIISAPAWCALCYLFDICIFEGGSNISQMHASRTRTPQKSPQVRKKTAQTKITSQSSKDLSRSQRYVLRSPAETDREKALGKILPPVCLNKPILAILHFILDDFKIHMCNIYTYTYMAIIVYLPVFVEVYCIHRKWSRIAIQFAS